MGTGLSIACGLAPVATTPASHGRTRFARVELMSSPSIAQTVSLTRKKPDLSPIFLLQLSDGATSFEHIFRSRDRSGAPGRGTTGRLPPYCTGPGGGALPAFRRALSAVRRDSN